MFGQELKKMGIATAYRYIEKNPKDNLRKLMTSKSSFIIFMKQQPKTMPYKGFMNGKAVFPNI